MSAQPFDEEKMSVNFKDLSEKEDLSTSSFNLNAKAPKGNSSPPKGRKPSLGPESMLAADGQAKTPMADSKKVVAFSNKDDDNPENPNFGSNKEIDVPKKEKKGSLDAKKIKSSVLDIDDDDAKENVESIASEQTKKQVADDEQELQKQASRASSKGSFNSATGEGGGKEIVENWTVKLLGCKFTFIALGLNILLFFGLKAMVSESGLAVSGAREFFEEAAGLVTELFMNISHICTAYAFQEGMSTYFGYLISQPKGYSIAVCAFCHSGILSQITFTSYLNYRSRSRKILSKASIIIAIHTVLIFLTPFSSSFVYTEELRADEGHLSCIIYNQKRAPYDRGVPTLETVFGSGEFIFGSSLGNLSSQMKIEHSVHVMPPQLIDGIDHGTEIIGDGFQTDVKTTCECPAVISASYLTTDLGIGETRANQILDKLSSFQNNQGMVNSIVFDKTSGNTSIITIFPGLSICGGLNSSSLVVPVCSTVLWNHKKAAVEALYMNDGSPTSIAIKTVNVRKLLDDAKPEWLYNSLGNLLGGDISGSYLPVTYPGSTNTLLRWATTNLQSISSSSLSAGVETMFCILLRAAIQRSYSYSAYTCEQNIVDPLHVVVRITYNGYVVGCLIAFSLIAICCISLIGSIFWFINPSPILPALRLTKESLYFRMMLGPLLDNGRITNYHGTMPIEEFWP